MRKPKNENNFFRYRWRINSTPENWNKIFRYFGIKKNLVIFITSYGIHKKRGKEILEWIKKYENLKKEKYAVIDDEDFDIKNLIPKENFFHINSNIGISKNDVKKIIQFFNKKLWN